MDLQFITTRPHPYNSRANDAVRSYIMTRLEQIQSETGALTIDNDILSNTTWYADKAVHYFEGNNIVVKIEGQQSALKGVLLSAHYDSVYVSYGATDDGMGIATLLQLVSYFAKNKPSRSVIFNINNNEESGLHGAHAFLKHPWSKDVGFFLNLEGAGAGGLPIVFRTSSYQVTQALKTSPHPHGSILCTDAYTLGLIRSGTDYSVYTAAGMSGLDFAFYQRRSYYHTLRDTISSLDGHGSLWTFMDSTLSMGIALSQIEPVDTADSQDNQLPLHFDIFATALALFTLKHFFVANIIVLVIGLSFYIIHGVYADRSLLSSQAFSKDTIYLPLTGIFSIILLVGLCFAYVFINPYIVHSSNYLVAFTFWILAFVAFHLPLSYLAENLHETILYEMNLFWWLVLLLNAVLLIRRGIGGLYFVTFFYVTSLLALMISSLETKETAENTAGVQDSDLASERTPLLPRRNEQDQTLQVNHGSCWLWSLKILLCVPVPVCLMMQIGIIVLNALSQTLPDGSSPLFVYAFIALVSLLLVLPIVPFVAVIPRYVSFALILLFILISGVNLLSPPFLEQSPLKVFYHQNVNLTDNTNTVQLAGLEGYIQKVAHQIPSALHNPIVCEPSDRGLTACSWSSATTITRDMVSVSTETLQPGQATLKLKGEDTRFCRIRFDTPVVSFHVHETTGDIQEGYLLPPNRVKELRFWSRERGKEFLVDVTWPANETLRGRASCQWSDSEDWEKRSPAFQEVLAFLPSWSLASSLKDGPVEASLEFTV